MGFNQPISNSKNVPYVMFGNGSLSKLDEILSPRRTSQPSPVIFLVDHYFRNSELVRNLPVKSDDIIKFIDTTSEPTTDGVDSHHNEIRKTLVSEPVAVVGIGGGSTLDTAKAISNLLNNPGTAAEYQGWDLLTRSGVFKIGVPTISGTGAEASRTCVMMNYSKNLKLGMNSDHSIFDQLILDPTLTASAPREQYFYTGMDTFIHCIESLAGNHRHPIADQLSRQALQLSSEVFLANEMMSEDNRLKLMLASYFGGCAIANSFVGIVHPLSAALSVVFRTHHCVANCMVMNVMEEFYPEATNSFQQMLRAQEVSLPKLSIKCASSEVKERLFNSTIIHEKPLRNALGDSFKEILTKEKCLEIFERIE